MGARVSLEVFSWRRERRVDMGNSVIKRCKKTVVDACKRGGKRAHKRDFG